MGCRRWPLGAVARSTGVGKVLGPRKAVVILANESAQPAGSHISPLANQDGHRWRPWGQRRSSVNVNDRLPFKVCHLRDC